jgi:hypothetical protein
LELVLIIAQTKGLHENDFIMAAKIDRSAQPPNG